MKKLVVYYNFVVISVMILVSFLKADTSANLISAALFFPLFIYFIDLIAPRRQKAIAIVTNENIPPVEDVADSKVETGEVLENKTDEDRRVFLKIIASAGAGLFLMTIFTRRTEAAFFGSSPSVGTVSLKDSTGSVIDPAIKSPTDGYKISEIDDSGILSYYGFVNKSGAWFIMKEDASGENTNYKYVKGDSDFTTNWANRADISMVYAYFDETF